MGSFELHRKVRSTFFSSATIKDRYILNEMANSGIHAAMAMLAEDKLESGIDSLQEDWANPEKIKEVLQEIPFDDGTLTVHISDEFSRIQVNALVKSPGGRVFDEPQLMVWDRFLRWIKSQNESFEDIDPLTIINSLKDWMDSGDDDAITGLTGAESDYYQELDPSYSCRNGPLRHPAELVRIKGITPELYDGVGDLSGISNYVTVYGLAGYEGKYVLAWTGKININTAPLPVLIALLPDEVQDQEIAQEIIEYREEKDGETYVHDLSSPIWYKEIPALTDIEIDHMMLITTRSDTFRIESTATIGELKTTITAVIQREPQKETQKLICRVLSWDVE